MSQDNGTAPQYRWALLRFSIISGLLASPPERGELGDRIHELISDTYRDPVTGESKRFSFSTVERWYYMARDAPDPMAVLRRNVRKDAGVQHIHAEVVAALERQYRQYPRWTYKLHADNVTALVEENPDWGAPPSYPTVRRAMKRRGWLPMRGKRGRKLVISVREVRSYEASHVHALWHLDFHEGGRRVAHTDGSYFTPWLFAAIDDRSRVICHAQWYEEESARTLAHGLHQAFLRRGVPRAIMSDRGGAELAAETENGLADCGVAHKPTLAWSPHQNAKQERFWGTLEGRLMSMLKGLDIDLEFLNRSTLAWIEQEYHHTKHEEIDQTPMEALLEGPSVARPAPAADTLRFRFTVRATRTLRRTDGTISIDSIRFEIPTRLHHLRKLHVRYRRWNYKRAWVIDPATDEIIAQIKPLDKRANADGVRRAVEAPSVVAEETVTELPPLMRKIMREFAATGLPAPYIPSRRENDDD